MSGEKSNLVMPVKNLTFPNLGRTFVTFVLAIFRILSPLPPQPDKTVDGRAMHSGNGMFDASWLPPANVCTLAVMNEQLRHRAGS